MQRGRQQQPRRVVAELAGCLAAVAAVTLATVPTCRTRWYPARDLDAGAGELHTAADNAARPVDPVREAMERRIREGLD